MVECQAGRGRGVVGVVAVAAAGGVRTGVGVRAVVGTREGVGKDVVSGAAGCRVELVVLMELVG